MKASLHIGAALALCAALAACTTTHAPPTPDDAGPTVYATRVFRFPSDLALEHGDVPLAGSYFWRWPQLTEEATTTGLITAHWQALGEAAETWQAFPYIHYDHQEGALASTNVAFGPGVVILNLFSTEPIPPGVMEPEFAELGFRFRVTVYVP